MKKLYLLFIIILLAIPCQASAISLDRFSISGFLSQGYMYTTDNDFFGPINFGNVASVSTILKLRAKDKVEVFAQSSTAGFIAVNTDGQASTHFEAARFPSPT